MKCEDCELLLAGGEVSAAVEDHLRDCAACQALAADLRTNHGALAQLRAEELPPVSIKIPRRRWLYGPIVAAAAVAAALLIPRTKPAPMSPVVETPPSSQIKVKMLTSDPHVVIYWLLDN